MQKIHTGAIDSPLTGESIGEFLGATGASIPARFEQIAGSYAQQVAIGSGSWQPTYAELNAAADALASEVRLCCVPGSRVVLLHRLDGFLIGSILGVLKAGCVLAIFNPEDPVPRLRQNIEDVEPALIIGEPGTVELAAQITAPSIPVMLFSGTLAFSGGGAGSRTSGAGGAPHHADAQENVDDVAFLFQTSGTTGRPKWVTRSQRSIVAGSANHNIAMRIGPGDRVLLLSSPGSNQTTGNLLCALLYGATICPFPIAEKGIIGLADWLRRHDITVYVSPASAFRHFLKTLKPEERFPRIRLVRLASEAILAEDLRAGAAHFNEDSVYYCSYNSSETGNMMQLRLLMREAPAGSRLPLGNPAMETEILLFDEAGHAVADGEVGEIVARSPFLSAGYWRDEKLTAERFKTAPDGTRVYYSGDLARREADGALYYFGRRDDMVKIRGSRVMLREVEQNLRLQPAVQDAAVLARPLPDGSRKLVAFVVRKNAEAPSSRGAQTIRKGLATILPDHAVPAEFVFLEQIPVNANGKVDRAALLNRAESQAAAFSAGSFSAGGLSAENDTSTAVMLSEIWAGVLGDPAGTDAGFFDAGGDSLTAGVVAARVHAALGVELDMLDFIQHPTFSALVRRIDDLQRQSFIRDELQKDRVGLDTVSFGFPPLERCQGRSQYPLSFLQESIWRHCRKSPEANRNYSMARSYGLRGPLDVAALREAMAWVEAQNEVLRTTFPVINGEPVQIVHPPAPIALPFFDFSGYPDARERGVAQMREEVRRPLDLGNGPVLRHTLIRIAPDEHWLFRLCHHLVYDALSWGSYLRELESAYESLRKGQRPPAESESSAQAKLQYGDFAVWERTVYAPGGKPRERLVRWWEGAFARPSVNPVLPLRGRPMFQRVFRIVPKPPEGWLWCGLNPSTQARLDDIARGASVTGYTLGLAAFAALLARIGGRKAQPVGPRTVLLGTYVTNRRSPALQNMQGDFAHMLPMCLEIPEAGTFIEWLPDVQKHVADVQAHGQLPPEQLWEDLRSRGVTPPEINAMFRGPGFKFPTKFGELDLADRPYEQKSKGHEQEWTDAMPWGFILRVDLGDLERSCQVTFDARIYHRKKVRAFLRAYTLLLDRLSSEPDLPMASLLGAGK